MSLPVEYFVRWRNHSESFRVLAYDKASGVLTPTPYFDQHLERLVTDTEVAFLLDGEYLLFLSACGTVETGLISTRIVPHEYPRLEFCRREDSLPEILATVSQSACLRVANYREGEFDPSEEDAFNFFDSIQISRAGLVAVRLNEIQLLTDRRGEYLGTSDDLLVANRTSPCLTAAIPYLLADDQRRYVSTEDAHTVQAKP